jgi:hypothetical protein
MVRLCGAALGFIAFSVTILLGMTAGNTFESTVERAIWAMLTFCGLGLGVGWISRRIIEEHSLALKARMFGDDVEETEAQEASTAGTGQNAHLGAASKEPKTPTRAGEPADNPPLKAAGA